MTARLAIRFRELHLSAAVMPTSESELIAAIDTERRLARMKKLYGTLLIARYVHGLTIDECAKVCGRSPRWAAYQILEATLEFANGGHGE